MIANLKMTMKFILLAVLIPISAGVVALIALRGTEKLKYEYDNLYGFMLLPIMDIDQGNLHLQRLEVVNHTDGEKVITLLLRK